MIAARRLIALPLLVAALAAASPAAAGSGPPGPPGFQPKDKAAAAHLRLQRQAIALINAASQHVRGTVAGCKLSFPSSTSKPTHDAPTQPVLDAIAALRRPARPDELSGAAARRGFGGETYVDYVRQVATADGHPLTIVIGRSVRRLFVLPSRCYDAQHRYLVEHLADRPRRLRSVTLEEFSHVRQGQEANRQQQTDAPVDGIYLFDRGGGGGGADVASFRQRGVFNSFGGPGGSSRLNGLVPDGVATVTLEYPKSVSRGEYFKPAVFPKAVTLTVPVHENVLSVRVPRGAPDAFPHHMIWRDAAGNVVNDFTDPHL